MLTILAVIGCAATLQTAGGLNVMMQFAERLLRKHRSTSRSSRPLPPGC
jgi:anaerobic C4-dicarboxylate transporter DcuB